MRYIIYGAGGIGSIMGGQLARADVPVALIGRAGHVNAINGNGLKLVTPTGTYMLEIPAFTGPEMVDFTPDDVVFLCMKGQDTEKALRELKKHAPEVPIFCFQNGVRNEEIAAQYFSKVYGVMVRVGAVYLKDGEVMARRDPPGWYIIGRYPKGTDDLMEEAAADLRAADYLVKTTEDVMPYKWGKLMANLGNAIGAITDADWNSTAAIYKATFEEAREIVARAGIKWISQEQVSKDWPEINAPLRGQVNTREQSSTWQSLERKQGSVETDFLNGEIVRAAKKIGVKAPINEMLVTITQEMAVKRERPGKYTPKELERMLGIKPGTPGKNPF